MAQEESILSGMAARYASALFSLAQEQNAMDAVASDLAAFEALMNESADLRRLVRSPAFSALEQSKGLNAVLERAAIGGLAAKFFQLVAAKRRLFAIADMIAAYRTLLDRAHGVTRAQITVAEPLGEEHLATLRKALQDSAGASSVEIAVKVDPAIIGGLIVRVGSRMVDGSLRTKLNSIRTRMKEVG